MSAYSRTSDAKRGYILTNQATLARQAGTKVGKTRGVGPSE